ncbi:nephrocystin-4-like isoform X2 [Apostichopus japonicus]|uniref:nephrocystin-4-like isoform X2 n=1 Tax=Stichopus japonicus TaxID=307972 RepID=UPI003AB7E3DE
MALTSGPEISQNPLHGTLLKGGSLPSYFKTTAVIKSFAPAVSLQLPKNQSGLPLKDFKQHLTKAKLLPPDLRRSTTLYNNWEEEEDRVEPEALPLCLVIHTLENVAQVDKLPRQKEKGKAETEYFIRLSIFDVTFKRFFGKTWTGPRKVVKAKGNKKTLLHYNTPVYFHTSLTEPNIVLVAEIVGIVEDKNGRIHHLSCGWSVLRIFQQGEFVDASSGSPAPVKRVDVFHGSPRALLYLDDDIEGHKLITLVADCQLCYSIKTHRLMEKISHLIPENAFFSGSDVVPGVAVADDGDNFRKPKPLKKIHGVLDKINIVLPPSVEKFEEDLCQLVNADRMAKENIQADRAAVKVAERRLHVNLHNGWEYVDKPQIVMLDADVFTRGGNRGSLSRGKHKSGMSGSRESLLSSLQVKSKIQLKSLVDDPLYAVLFLLEYIVTIPVSDQEKKLAGSMRRSQTQSYFIRWAAWTPDLSQPTRDVSMPLEGGLAHNPDQVLIYAKPDDTEKGKDHGGTISFSFKLKDLKPPSGGQFSSMMSLPSQTSEGSALHEVNAPLSGKPPLGRSPRRFQQSAMSNYSAQGMDSARSNGGIESPAAPFGYPLQITHLENERDVTDSSYQEQLQEIPFAPVHAPIIPTLTPKESGPGMSRAAYAYLYQAGFPAIQDRHGEPPELVDVLGHAVLRPKKESVDPLQCNEIVVQFLALARPFTNQQPSRTDFPKTVFFTFQFYRYPAVTTERLLVSEPDNKVATPVDKFPLVLRKLKEDEITAKETDPGWMISYRVDPEYLKPGEGHLFIRHLYLQTLHIDVWDGDSLLLIGSCAVQLKHLLRGGREAVQIASELDIVTSEYNEAAGTMTGDLSRSGSVRPVGVANLLRGHLHVRLANIGHPVDKTVAKAATLPFQSAKVVIQDDGSGAFLGGRLNSTSRHSDARATHLSQNRTFMASHMAEVDQEVATALFSRTGGQNKSDSNEMSSKQQRKLNRMKAVRESLGKEKNEKFLVKKEEKVQRSRDLKTIEIQRSLSKKEGILLMLQSVITTQHTIHPTFAAAEYFEFELRNPYNVEHTIAIQWEDRELGVMTNFKELRYLKKIFKLTTTNMEEGMFINPTDDEHLGLGVHIFLKPKEKVFIPFKYQSFRTNHQVPPQGPSAKHYNNWTKQMTDVDDTLESKTVKVFFRTQDNKPIAVLSLSVEPQPHIVNQTFRFQHPEQSFLKKSIRLPPFNAFTEMMGHSDLQRQVYVKCSDENVICESKKLPSSEPQDVFIKVACGPSPSVKKFYVVIYLDPFICKPVQIWQFYIHALHRMDVSCMEGQTQSFSLILKGTTASRLVKCFSSHPQEMAMTPSDPFMLMANAVHEVQVYVSPKQKGCKNMYINVVDTDYHQLVRTWLIAVTCREPVISKGFELTLPIGGGKGSNKKISYKNPYSTPKTFIVKCNRPDLVQFKETKLKMDGGETTNLGMRFAPCQYMGSIDIYIFINDEMDKNEETFLVRATYKP